MLPAAMRGQPYQMLLAAMANADGSNARCCQ